MQKKESVEKTNKHGYSILSVGVSSERCKIEAYVV